MSFYLDGVEKLSLREWLWNWQLKKGSAWKEQCRQKETASTKASREKRGLAETTQEGQSVWRVDGDTVLRDAVGDMDRDMWYGTP